MLSSYNKLSPFAIKLVQSTAKFCKENLNLPSGIHILIAISGGADSISLAHILKYLAYSFDFRLSAVSINHGLRKEAEEEAIYSRTICNNLGIPCSIESFEARELAHNLKIGLEEACRTGRYKILEACRQSCKADYIALGHQNYDLSEDILMRMIRGCGWPALGGMKAIDEQRHLIRPLLFAHPADLKHFLSDIGVTWKEDCSNDSPQFLRNRIRKDLLPRIRAENPSLESCFQNIHELSLIDEDYWYKQIEQIENKNLWREIKNDNEISIIFYRKQLINLHKALRFRLYLYAIKKISDIQQSKDKVQTRAHTIFKFDKALIEYKGKKIFQFGKGIYAEIDSKNVNFKYFDKNNPFINK